MSASNNPALEGLIRPEFEKQLSATEIWKANLLAIYTKQHKFEKHEPKHSWQYIAEELRWTTSEGQGLARTPWKAWVCDIEAGFPKLDKALDTVLKDTWAAKVLQYLYDISDGAAHQSLADALGGNAGRDQDISDKFMGDKLHMTMVS